MKKAIAFLMVACVFLSLCACNATDYKKAVSLSDNGEYESALELFLTLGDYKESKAYIQECRYQLALNVMDKGDYAAAIEKLMVVGDYKDSAECINECKYQLAQNLISEKEYVDAIEILMTMGGYKDSAECLSRAKWDALYEYIVDEGGYISFQIGNDSSRKLYIQTNDNGTMNVILKGTYIILTLKENVTCQLTLEYGNEQAKYTFVSEGAGNWKVTEVQTATINTADFSSTMPVPNGFYQRTTVKPNETIVMFVNEEGSTFPFVVEPAHTEMCENLPLLLNKTGLPITAADLGFMFEQTATT